MARAAKKHALAIAVFCGETRNARARVSGLRDKLVDHAVEFLSRVKMIVPVEDGRDAMVDKQLMNGRRPAGATPREFISSIRAFAAPFVETRRFHPATTVLVEPADKMVDKNEFGLRLGVFERLLKPTVLRLPECPIPAVHSPPKQP